TVVFDYPQLWKSDGTEAGTTQIKSSASNIVFMASSNGILFFSALTSNNGEELWRSDGTPEGTFLLKDILPGPDSSWPSQKVDLNGILIFGTGGNNQVWRTDGTLKGTVLIKKIDQGTDSAN